MSAVLWERAYQEGRTARASSPTRNASACNKRREQLRAEGLCIFCGQSPATSLCDDCKRRQREQTAERYRAAVEREGRRVRPYRRKGSAA
ncbi:MAG: hypothetical protein H0X14_00100 [Acidobacteria bacterium]|nr:hypothetical protein [Acidobacteriota bacterium]